MRFFAFSCAFSQSFCTMLCGNFLGLALFLAIAFCKLALTNIIFDSYPILSNIVLYAFTFVRFALVVSKIIPSLPSIYASIFFAVSFFAFARIGSTTEKSAPLRSSVSPAFLSPFSNARSVLTSLSPNAFRDNLSTTVDLPEPGPPEKKTALNVPGS